ncbi:acetyltransferase [Actinoplanes sp. LDG1-06]|uniref:Acetyltransferase n=1 Tax=Paractinoplanes ovalisporus TaxID=2810368 RepID=A0ABS2A7W8_9ACTN|nr:acetyltransferase [Actinoplanes ovalisporus]MBM2615939.1 acetyltransferase [Actinoplanes ovalisporus]
MSSVVCRNLLPAEVPLLGPGFAEGLASGGFDLSRTWVALRDGVIVARAAWVLPPDSVGDPWLERFDLDDSPETGAALLTAAHQALGGPYPFYAVLPVAANVAEAARLAGLVPTVERHRFRWTGPAPAAAERAPAGGGVRAAAGAHAGDGVRAATGEEAGELVARIPEPDVLTGSETARTVAGLDLAHNPVPWVTGPAAAWHVLDDESDGGGVAGTAGDACWPMLVYLGVLPGAAPGARERLLAASLRALAEGGAEEVIADVVSTRTETIADLEAAGFHQIRARLAFEPRDRSGTVS